MKKQLASLFFTLIILIPFLNGANKGQASKPHLDSTPSATSTPESPNRPTHEPYNPFDQSDSLHIYPYGQSTGDRYLPLSMQKPEGIYPDVTHISDAQIYKRSEV